RPILALAKNDAVVGEEVASYGYGYGLDQPLARIAHVSARNVDYQGITYTMLDSPVIRSQSGGPVLNATGEIAMVVIGTNDVAALAMPASQIRKHIGRFISRK